MLPGTDRDARRPDQGPRTQETVEREAQALFDFWYRAARGDGLRRGKLTRARILDTPLVVGRDKAGRAFAMLDACPHRGMPLSYGWFDGEKVQCAYHGWCFDAQSGQCRSIPSLSKKQTVDLTKISAGHLPCEERDGYVWVFMARAEPGSLRRTARPSGPAPALPVFSEKYRSFCLSSVVPIAADHGLASLLDPAHGAFVHAKVWWFARLLLGIHPDAGEGAEQRDITREFVPIPLGFREIATQPIDAPWFRRQSQSDVVEITADCVLPYYRALEVRTRKYWITGLATVTPLTPTTCRIDLIMAWYFFYFWPFAATVFKFLFWVFFLQDKQTMARQAQGVGMVERPIFLDDADKPIRWYHQIRRAYLESRRDGTPFDHPMREAATVTWRSPDVSDIVG
jgi:phenylpropionate dioxygenase-like ring-hydroxylating dioxygenase large terminal subunit